MERKRSSEGRTKVQGGVAVRVHRMDIAPGLHEESHNVFVTILTGCGEENKRGNIRGPRRKIGMATDAPTPL